jgi:BirA family transcriptional regulator, biotin operon repressor / biotin---[acetyl-CoA-carboxylase] ligase
VPHNSRIRKVATIRSSRTSPVTVDGTPTQTDTRLGRIVRLLNDYATVVVSGTKIADEIGTNRSEVWRLIQQLRGLGVAIEGHPATGYRLATMPDLLLPEILAPLVRSTIFSQNIHHYFKVGSTNTIAMHAASEGASEGTVFLAEQQTAGRGRGGHAWHSVQSSGIYCSVVLRPVLPPSEVLILSLAAALAVHSAVQSEDPKVPVDLKWPNDLLIAGQKFCGVLTEMNAEATRVRHIVVGIGINANHESFPAELRPIATSLRLASGKVWSRVELCAALLKSLDREYRALLEKPDARESVLKRFQERSSSVRDRKVFVTQDNGGFEGTTYGLDARGFLQVRTLEGLRVVLSGTVQLH